MKGNILTDVNMGTYVGILKYASKDVRELFRDQLKSLVEQTKNSAIRYRRYRAYIVTGTVL